jgi:hypothetical protein
VPTPRPPAPPRGAATDGPGSLPGVTFRPEAIRGAGSQNAAGVIDYRLARQAVVSEFRKGRLARHEVCDAHPELRRAAQLASDPTSMPCPICEETNVVLVTYAFGSRLPPSGRCITAAGELAKLAKRIPRLACYVVEVCPGCSWNHLARTFLLGT